VGQLDIAGTAPGGPQIDQDGLAFKRLQLPGLARQVV
jgi:hypothetical protein